MIKVGGNERHIGLKYVKTRKFYEIKGEFAKAGGKRKFFWGNVLKDRK